MPQDALDDLVAAAARDDLAGANAAAFAWAAALAATMNRPAEVDVIGGVGGNYTALYRVVAVEWFHWATDTEIGRPTLHLFRSWANHRGTLDGRSAGLVGVHPEQARPRYAVEQEFEAQMVPVRLVPDIAAEAPRLMQEWGL
jgi:hypothetical protein